MFPEILSPNLQPYNPQLQFQQLLADSILCIPQHHQLSPGLDQSPPAESTATCVDPAQAEAILGDVCVQSKSCKPSILDSPEAVRYS